MNAAPTITRFSIKPRRHLHIDDARIAIISWLWAHKYNGKMVLVIEDLYTCDKAFIKPILQDLDYLKLDYEGPIFQSDRRKRYREAVDELMEKGYAYPCTESNISKQLPIRGCLRNSSIEAIKVIMNDDRFPVRFRMPDNEVFKFGDMVQGIKTWNSASLSDSIILSEYGEVSEEFASVVDDIDFKVTNLIRKSSDINDMSERLAYFYGLTKYDPVHAHLPALSGKNGKLIESLNTVDLNDCESLFVKLGCDEGHCTNPLYLACYRTLGVPPTAIINDLATLGWRSHFTDMQTIAQDTLEFKFTLNRFRQDTHPEFSSQSLLDLSRRQMKEMPLEDMVNACMPILQQSGLLPECVSIDQLLSLADAIDHCREDFRFYSDVLMLDYLYRKPIFDNNAYKLIKMFCLSSIMPNYIEFLQQHTSWDSHTLGDNTQQWCIENAINLSDLLMVIHLALTGRREMGSFDVLARLGKDEAIERISSLVEQSKEK